MNHKNINHTYYRPPGSLSLYTRPKEYLIAFIYYETQYFASVSDIFDLLTLLKV